MQTKQTMAPPGLPEGERPKRMDSKDTYVLERTRHEMETSPIPLATLVQRLSDPDYGVQVQSITALVEHPQRMQATGRLLTLLADPNEPVCMATVQALGQLGASQAIPALLPV